MNSRSVAGESLSPSAECPAPPKARRWARRIGAIGFWFFFLKGCFWLASLGIAFALAR